MPSLRPVGRLVGRQASSQADHAEQKTTLKRHGRIEASSMLKADRQMLLPSLPLVSDSASLQSLFLFFQPRGPEKRVAGSALTKLQTQSLTYGESTASEIKLS